MNFSGLFVFFLAVFQHPIVEESIMLGFEVNWPHIFHRFLGLYKRRRAHIDFQNFLENSLADLICKLFQILSLIRFSKGLWELAKTYLDLYPSIYVLNLNPQTPRTLIHCTHFTSWTYPVRRSLSARYCWSCATTKLGASRDVMVNILGYLNIASDFDLLGAP